MNIKNILLLILILLITSCSTNKTTSALAFEHHTADNIQFYLMKADGSQLELLTSIPSYFTFYGFSPDGTKMITGSRPLFLSILEVPSGKTIKTIRDAGLRELHELAEESHIVSWSPNGNQLVFVREISPIQGTQLILYDLLNDEQLVLTNDEALYRDPVWSPDGKQIAAVKFRSCGSPPWQCPPEKNNWDIVLFNLDSKTSQQLTNFDNIPGKHQDLWSKSLCGLEWSPNGKYILFENSCSQFGLNEGKEIFIVSVESKQVFQLTDFDYIDGRYIARYSANWVDDDDQLFVGYSIIPMMPPSAGLIAQYGYTVYQDGNFTEGHSFTIQEDQTIHPRWSTFRGEFILTQRIKDTNCSQLIWGDFDDSEFVGTPKTQWPPLLETYSNIVRSLNGDYLAYLTSGEKCNEGIGERPNIVLIDLNNDQIILPDTHQLSGDIELIDWFEMPVQ